MREATKIRIPADDSKLLSEILELLDPEEYAIITFKSDKDRISGYYVIQFGCKQPFDPNYCFEDCNFNAIEFIE